MRKTVMKGMEKPSAEQVKIYLNKWKNQEKYDSQEKAIEKLFAEHPKNTELSYVLLKAAVLNTFYSTNIYDIHSVAKHICSIRDIDERLHNGDENLVSEVQVVEIGEGDKKKSFHFYSFATKYCSHHNPLRYPIYDNYVATILGFYKMIFGFDKFREIDLKDYKKFKEVLKNFMDWFQLNEFTVKEIDQYLWQVGNNLLGIDKIINTYYSKTKDIQGIENMIRQEYGFSIQEDYIRQIVEIK